MKKIFTFCGILLMCLLSIQSSSAAGKELYGVVEGSTMTVRFDYSRTGNGGTLLLDMPSATRSAVTKIIIDNTVTTYSGSETAQWFSNYTNLRSVEGLDYIPWEDISYASFMFQNCSSLPEIDLNGLRMLKQGVDCIGMFMGCSNLTTIHCNHDFSSRIGSSTGMFSNCYKLKGGMGTSYASAHSDATYARPDRTGQPGYFTSSEPEEDVVYAVLSGSTMTLYYDKQKLARGGSEDWSAVAFRGSAHTVVFDPSMDNARPVSTARWLNDFYELREIQGMQYLHTDEVTDMQAMFADCAELLAIDLSAFNTEKVKDMNAMFMNCYKLQTIDVNSFDVSRVTDMTRMFYFCKNLTTIYCKNDWFATANAGSVNMFYNCQKLVGGNGTAFDASHVELNYARPDILGQPGYFTGETGAQEGIITPSGSPSRGEKVLRNGMLLINRNGKTYNAQGAEVK